MKRYLLASLLSSSLFAQIVNITPSWQLLGTSAQVENLSNLNSSCISQFWSYDKSWQSLSELNTLPKERGFWVKGSGSCEVELKGKELISLKSNSIDKIQDLNPFIIELNSPSDTILTASLKDNSLATISLESNTLKVTPSGKYGSTTIMLVAINGDDIEVKSIALNLLESVNTIARGFTPLVSWDEVSVRRVLHTFAYGGFARDSQIKSWADMNPQDAIKEMLTLDNKNSKLSPSSESLPNGDLEALSSYFASNSSIYDENLKKNLSSPSNWSAPRLLWLNSVNKRGLNPFRQKIGLWESNYHMAVNQNAGVYPHPLIRHYDNIMNAHKKNFSYEKVLAQGSKDSAIAYQYGHNRNVFKNGSFSGNEDFARELHQLFFGILGEYNHQEHEFYTIRNTARALSGMEAKWHSDADGGVDVDITFNKSTHYPSSLNILNSEINGSDASEKLDNIAKIAIEHSESEKNLPIMIISNLADDNLDEVKKAKIIEAWQDMEQKNFLDFIRSYAISETFHNSSRIKYRTVIDRLILMTNLISTENLESYNNFYRVDWQIDDSSTPFAPIHDVFGGQRGLEAYSSANVFQKAYNLNTEDIWFLTQVTQKDKDKNIIYQKDFTKIVPKSSDGTYRVSDVAEWLWNRFIADGLKNFGTLEKAHIYALLAGGKDLAYFLDEQNPTRVYTKSELEGEFSDYKQKLDDAKVSIIDLGSSDEKIKLEANTKIALAIAFITATPYMFVEEGK